jgi:predicted GNAT family acetyltransferase
MPTFDMDHDAARRRYTLLVDGRPSSFAEYLPSGDGTTMVFHHTVTPTSDRGQGYAAELVRRALDDVRAAGRTVVATCWYVDQFIADHPEYQDLVSGTGRVGRRG